MFLVALGCLVVLHRIMHFFLALREARMISPRFLTVVVLLVSASAVLWRPVALRTCPPANPLSAVPRTIAGWSGTDVLDRSANPRCPRQGRFPLARLYPQQRFATGSDFLLAIPHAENGRHDSFAQEIACQATVGPLKVTNSHADLIDANGKPHHVGEYVITNGDSRQFVIYWYQSNTDAASPNEYMAKIYLVTERHANRIAPMARFH